MSLSVDVLNTKGEKVSSMDLPASIFDVKAPIAVVHEVVNAHLANLRRGTHSTKTKAEVSGGGIKPWKQKHTGRARAGSSRSPLWRHGGIIFGPKPRSYFQNVSEAKRHLSLKKILSDFVKEGRLRVVESFSVSEPKTKRVAEIVKKLNMPEKSLVVLDKIDPTLRRAAGNFAGFRLCRALELNSYNALQAEQLIFTRPALDQMAQRLGGGEKPAGTEA